MQRKTKGKIRPKKKKSYAFNNFFLALVTSILFIKKQNRLRIIKISLKVLWFCSKASPLLMQNNFKKNFYIKYNENHHSKSKFLLHYFLVIILLTFSYLIM